MCPLTFRSDVTAADTAEVTRLVKATGFFSPAEVEVAVELVQERRLKGESCGYHFLLAEREPGALAGYGCFGPTPCTQSSFGLYWIVVHPDAQGRGLGRRLMALCEERIAGLSGTRVYAETSSRPQYHPTRCFYERCGYRLEARLKDFYAPGDDKLIYCKVLEKIQP